MGKARGTVLSAALLYKQGDGSGVSWAGMEGACSVPLAELEEESKRRTDFGSPDRSGIAMNATRESRGEARQREDRLDGEARPRAG